MTYTIILERAGDFERLRSWADRPGSRLLPVSADGWAGVPNTWPEDRLLSLDTLVDRKDLQVSINRLRKAFLKDFYKSKEAPYYKIKQIVDSFCEKAVIVDRIAELPGEKLFIDQRWCWLAPEHDSLEALRLMSLCMKGRNGFRPVAVDRLPVLWFVLRPIVKTLRDVVFRWMDAMPEGSPLVFELTYGADQDFQGRSVRHVDHGAILVRLVKGLLRGLAKPTDVLFLLVYNRPVFLPRGPWRDQMVVALNEVMRRAGRLHRIFDGIARKEGWRTAPYLFSVKHGTMLEDAVVEAARSQGVPVYTMQHACVGHDEWTASQYIDAWRSDGKIVATPVVAEELAQFETGRCDYLPAGVPHFAAVAAGLDGWDGRTLTYVLTGITHVNTMYDNRRLNDVLYLASIRGMIAALQSGGFSLWIKPHPYNSRQYGMTIERRLTEESGISLETGPLSSLPGALVIDSPSTILGDAVRAGRWVYIVNVTAVLRPRFADDPAVTGILHPTPEALVEHLRQTDRDILQAEQERFREFFLTSYIGRTRVPLPQAIAAHCRDRIGKASERAPFE